MGRASMSDRAGSGIDESVLASIRSQAARSEIEEDEAKAVLSRAANRRRIWTTLAKEVGQGRPIAAILASERALEQTDTLPGSDVMLLRELTEFLRPQAELLLAGVESNVPDALAA